MKQIKYQSDKIFTKLNNFSFLLFALCLITLPNKTLTQNIFNRQTLTGDWGGVRGTLINNGIAFEAVYTGEVYSNLSGGLHQSSVYLDNVDLTLALDAEKLFDWKGAAIFIYGLGDDGENPSENSGDIQGISSIAAYNTWKIYEAWIQQNLTDQKLSVLLGLYDLNSEFDALHSANFFLNPSHGIDPTFSQSGKNGPSIFPNATLGLRLKWSPVPSFYLQTTVLNGVAGNPNDPNGTQLILAKRNGILSTTEIGFINNPRRKRSSSNAPEHRRHIGRLGNPSYQGKIGVGLWFYSAKFAPLLNPEQTGTDQKIGGNLGFYLIAEQTIFHEKSKPDQSLEFFSRLGYANPKINRFVFYLGGGFVYTGLIPGRDQDVIGIAAAGAYNGNEYKQFQSNMGKQANPAEWNLELSYQMMIIPWLNLQPDIQYIIHPNTNPAIRNAFTMGIRTSITL